MAKVRADVDRLFGRDPESIHNSWDQEWKKVEAHLESTASRLEAWGKKHMESVSVSVTLNVGVASISVSGNLKP